MTLLLFNCVKVKIMTPFFIFPVNAGDKRGSLSNVARLALKAALES